MSVRVVQSLEEAIEHINQYSSRHTDAIVTDRMDMAQKFVREIDSSAVIANASTRFNDGGQLGMGAEIGISTDKFHAAAHVDLEGATDYLQIRNSRKRTRSIVTLNLDLGNGSTNNDNSTGKDSKCQMMFSVEVT